MFCVVKTIFRLLQPTLSLIMLRVAGLRSVSPSASDRDRASLLFIEKFNFTFKTLNKKNPGSSKNFQEIDDLEELESHMTKGSI